MSTCSCLVSSDDTRSPNSLRNHCSVPHAPGETSPGGGGTNCASTPLGTLQQLRHVIGTDHISPSTRRSQCGIAGTTSNIKYPFPGMHAQRADQHLSHHHHAHAEPVEIPSSPHLLLPLSDLFNVS